ncbi:MAG: hypothetical protein ABR583_02880 [Gaiellaceae bacterium]
MADLAERRGLARGRADQLGPDQRAGRRDRMVIGLSSNTTDICARLAASV